MRERTSYHGRDAPTRRCVWAFCVSWSRCVTATSGWPARKCENPACGNAYNPRRERQRWCSERCREQGRCAGQGRPCAHAACEARVRGESGYCPRHAPLHMKLPDRQCRGGCGTSFQPGSGNQWWCATCQPSRRLESRRGYKDKRKTAADEAPSSLERIDPALVPDSRAFGEGAFGAWIGALSESTGLGVKPLSRAFGLHELTLLHILKYRPTAPLAPKTRGRITDATGISLGELDRLRASREQFEEQRSQSGKRAYATYEAKYDANERKNFRWGKPGWERKRRLDELRAQKTGVPKPAGMGQRVHASIKESGKEDLRRAKIRLKRPRSFVPKPVLDRMRYLYVEENAPVASIAQELHLNAKVVTSRLIDMGCKEPLPWYPVPFPEAVRLVHASSITVLKRNDEGREKGNGKRAGDAQERILALCRRLGRIPTQTELEKVWGFRRTAARAFVASHSLDEVT